MPAPSRLAEAITPASHLLSTHTHRGGNLQIVLTFRREQRDLAALSQSLGRERAANLLQQPLLNIFSDGNYRGDAHSKTLQEIASHGKLSKVGLPADLKLAQDNPWASSFSASFTASSRRTA